MTSSPTFSPAAETTTPPPTSGPDAPRPSPPGPTSPASPWRHNHAYRRASLNHPASRQSADAKLTVPPPVQAMWCPSVRQPQEGFPGYFFTIPGMLFEILLREGMPAKWYEEGCLVRWTGHPLLLLNTDDPRLRSGTSPEHSHSGWRSHNVGHKFGRLTAELMEKLTKLSRI